jgi:hypothetical protein
MSDDDTIYPTHTCFTDAMEFLVDVVKHAPATMDEYTLVHAVCLPGSDRAYAHAWIERRTPKGTEAWQSGIWRRHRVQYAVMASELEQELRPQRIWRYSIEDASALNRETGMLGPWVRELEDLCTPHVCSPADLEAGFTLIPEPADVGRTA